MKFDSKRYRIDGDKNIRLQDFAPNDKSDVPNSKEERNAYVAALAPELDAIQEMLYAQHRRKVLIVLQGMDTAGKDGTIRAVFQSVDPLAVRTAYFKAPNEAELDRDFLWRVHQVVPRRGEMVIFNRSHYEDVLIQQVRGWIDEDEVKRRFEHIRHFEKLLSDTGTVIIKFFLHISKEEQRQRLQKRLDRPDKHWKFNPGDLDDRQLWSAYQAQYEKVINATASEYAPWYIIPADSKSARNFRVINILLETLQAMDLNYPQVDTSGWPKTVE